MITLYDADRCPYCARVRIVLAEKSVPYDTVVVDLSDRPAWLYEKNPLGKVPVLEEDGLCIPESAVIMELLEERFPEPPLYPADPAQRALARLAVWRFDDEFSRDYYAARRGDDGADERFASRLASLDRRLTESPVPRGTRATASPTSRGSRGCRGPRRTSTSVSRTIRRSRPGATGWPSGRRSRPRSTSSPR